MISPKIGDEVYIPNTYPCQILRKLRGIIIGFEKTCSTDFVRVEFIDPPPRVYKTETFYLWRFKLDLKYSYAQKKRFGG